jgi:hypothetical protein
MKVSEYTPRQRGIVLRALQDDGVLEYDPTTGQFGANRSPYLDELCRWAGVPLGSYWCAIWVGRVFADNSVKIPGAFPACDAWMPYLVDPKSLTAAQRVGCAILYGKRGTGGVLPDFQAMKRNGWDAKHIGIVTQWIRSPIDFVLTTEGNRGYAGSETNNGVAVDTAPLTRKDVLGLIQPVEAT